MCQTDPEGVAQVELTEPALQVILAIHKTQVEDRADIDYQQVLCKA